MLGGQCAVQFLNDTARGQVRMKSPEVGRARDGGCGDSPTQQGAMRVFGKSEVSG